MGRHKTVLALVVAWIWAGWMSAQAAEPVWDITDSSGLYPGGSALTYRKLEVTFKLTNPCGNPYLPYPANPTAAPAEQADAGGAKADPNGVTVTGVFTVPGGGEVRMPAFWDGEGVWRLRICPTKPGQWSYVIEVVNAKGASKSEPRTFMVAESKDPGFIRPAPKTRFLQFERGGTFIPLGNNLVKTADTTIIGSWAKRLREHGMNSQRVWLHPHYTAIEWTADGAKGKSLIPDAPGLGQYLLRTARAMDYVVDQAQENGLYLLLCQDDMICYTSSPHDEPRIGWEYNPYKAICKDGIEFFTNEVAKRYYKARLRYMVARWAWSPHVFSWELMNEVDWPYLAVVSPDKGKRWRLSDVAAWHNEMADYLRAADPHRRPVSTNTSSNMAGWGKAYRFAKYDDRFFVLHEKMELANHHVYQSVEKDNPTYYESVVSAFAKFHAGKPLIVGEWGLSPDLNEAEKDVKVPVGLHNAIWTGVMGGGAAPYHWHWDKYYEVGGLNQYQLLAKFLEGEDPLRDGMDLVACEAPGSNLRAYGMAGKQRALVWAWDTRSVQQSPAAPKPTGGKVNVPGLSAGRYRVDFVDPWSLSPVGTTKYISHSGAHATIVLPQFTRDVAMKITPQQ